MKRKHFILLSAIIIICQHAQAQIISTIAGNGTQGYSGDNGPATAAEIYYAIKAAPDGNGNVYITDQVNNRIRKIDASDIITTIAGNDIQGYNGDNIAATAAKLNEPNDMVIDSSGNIYVSDAGNNRIRKINTQGIITTFAGGLHGFVGDNGPATDAALDFPTGIAIDKNGNVYFSDFSNQRIRKVNTSGIITTIAGTGNPGFSGDNGAATAAELQDPYGVAVDGNDNIYIADGDNHRIRKIDASGIITTFAGNGINGYSGDNGPATAAELSNVSDVAVDGSDNVYIADFSNNRIRKVSADGIISTVAGNGTGDFSGDNGPATAAELQNPCGVALDGNDNMYISDQRNLRIRKVTGISTDITTVNNSNSFKITLSPNPAVDRAEITYTGADKDITVYMTDVTGRTVYTTNVTGQSGSVALPLQSLAPGYYMIAVQSGEQRIVSKLVKE